VLGRQHCCCAIVTSFVCLYKCFRRIHIYNYPEPGKLHQPQVAISFEMILSTLKHTTNTQNVASI
jgi:hypothetical protein